MGEARECDTAHAKKTAPQQGSNAASATGTHAKRTHENTGSATNEQCESREEARGTHIEAPTTEAPTKEASAKQHNTNPLGSIREIT